MAFTDYESSLLRGKEAPRPWNIQQEIRTLCQPDFHCLDLGCGTLFKWLPMAAEVNSLTGLEINPHMLRKAKENIACSGLSNVQLLCGLSAKLPFPDNSMDLITAIMAPSATEEEIFRVLKPSGYYLLETSTEQDQANIKTAFGKDISGWRGLSINSPAHTVYTERYNRVKQHTEDFSFRIGRWQTTYTREALTMLLTQVPMVRNFHAEHDIETLNTLFSTDDTINTFQERILLIARKHG